MRKWVKKTWRITLSIALLSCTHFTKPDQVGTQFTSSSTLCLVPTVNLLMAIHNWPSSSLGTFSYLLTNSMMWLSRGIVWWRASRRSGSFSRMLMMRIVLLLWEVILATWSFLKSCLILSKFSSITKKCSQTYAKLKSQWSTEAATKLIRESAVWSMGNS